MWPHIGDEAGCVAGQMARQGSGQQCGIGEFEMLGGDHGMAGGAGIQQRRDGRELRGAGHGIGQRLRQCGMIETGGIADALRCRLL